MSTLNIGGMALGLLFFVVFLLANIEPSTSAIHEVRSNNASNALTCTTGVAETTCALTLTQPHFYNATTNLTVTQTSPGSGLESATIANNKRTVTVSGLTGSTTYAFTVAYQVTNPALTGFGGFDQALEVIPLLMVIVVLVSAAFFGGAWAVQQ